MRYLALLLLFAVCSTAPAMANQPCGSFPPGAEQWPLDCMMGGHPRALSYRPAWPVDPGKPPGRLVIEHCISCACAPDGPCSSAADCTPIPDPAPSPDDQLCPERPSPITLKQWCLEVEALPVPIDTPNGVLRPQLAVCANALNFGQVVFVSACITNGNSENNENSESSEEEGNDE